MSYSNDELAHNKVDTLVKKVEKIENHQRIITSKLDKILNLLESLQTDNMSIKNKLNSMS